MRQARRASSVESIEIRTDTQWCGQIVPIYFNAWHYLDTNLWASLVTEIFDALFRQVAGDNASPERRQEKVKRLIAQLEKANGAAARAEDALRLAKRAKAEAEKEQHDLEAQAKRAAKQRDQIEGFIRGTIYGLEKIVPDADMKPDWKEAIEILHIEDARKSYAALIDAVAQFRSLHGRIQAIGRAIFAREGRTWRFSWLAGAMIGAPLLAGLAVWGLTYWNAELRRIGMAMGEISGFLAGVSAWCATQIHRSRKLVDQVENFEKASRKKRSVKNDDPELKRARAEVAKLTQEEEETRAKQREARAKVRRLDEELNEMKPERRLFHFIEERAQTQDYRAHLGLVSLVRRDFQELSRLFAETENNDGRTAVLDSQELGERAALARSIDRIVLFVDDLDRCQPERIVDVLQAVHLLLAYPLFAVVVGVDQRVLRQSIEKQFRGLISSDTRADVSSGPATSLDYLEKIFHVPFHVPPMGKSGYGTLIHNLIKSSEEMRPATSQSPREVKSMKDHYTTGEPAATDGLDVSENKGGYGLPREKGSGKTAHPLIGSVPLFSWEREALKDFFPLIRTPRAATRLLNTYRLVRAGIPAEEWAPFCGDQKMNGQFRLVMMLLAAAAGYPAVVRRWFAKLRTVDSSAILRDDQSDPNDEGWAQFKMVFDTVFEQTMPQLTKNLLAKWLDRVERFVF
jgi:hypothetical protein